MTGCAVDAAPLNARTRELLDRLDRHGVALVESLFVAGDRHPLPVTEEQMRQAVRAYSWLLQQLRHGVNLTSAGYLPPQLVRQAMVDLGWQRDWVGASSRESQTLPVLELRQSAQRAGLLRRFRGRLLLTRQGLALHQDPPGLWLHLAGQALPKDPGVESDAGILLLLVVAAGMPTSRDSIIDLVGRGLSSLGWAQRDGSELEYWHVLGSLRFTWQHLGRLHALPDRGEDSQALQRPPSSGSAFARAALRHAG